MPAPGLKQRILAVIMIRQGIFLLACMAVTPAIAEPVEYTGAVAWDVGYHWLTRQSEHFEITYPDGMQDLAERSLNIAEQVHEDLSGFFGDPMTRRTRLVLIDDFDTSNGYATPLPYPAIRLFASAPDGSTGLESYDDWLHMLIRHEYAHVLHLEMGRGMVSGSRMIFGRAFFNYPNLFTPSFLIEGLAVYLETNREQGYGRLQDSLYLMQMRAELMNGMPDSLGKIVLPMRDWPLGKQYLYGAWFIDYLVRSYGEERLRYFLRRYSGRILPWTFLNRDARAAFGLSFTTLWAGFLADLYKQQQQAVLALQKNAVDGQHLPTSVWFRPALASSQGVLYSIDNNGEDETAIRRHPDRRQETLLEPENGRDLAVAADGTVAFSRYVYRASGAEWSDIFLIRDGDEIRLTRDLRARRLRWLPDSSALIVSRQVAGISELLKVNRNTGEAISLWQGEYGDVLGEFTVSPDGAALVASLKRPQQGWNLERFDLAAGQWQELTRTRARENSPSFAESGALLFSADYDGVFDIYRLQPGADQVERLTRTATGVFSPLQVENKLVFSRYSRDGYQLHQMPYTDDQVIETLSLASLEGERHYSQPWQVDAPLQPEEEYSAFSSLLPTAWYPSFTTNPYRTETGVLVSGSDALGRQRYSLEGRWDDKHNRASMMLDYAWDSRWQLRLQRGWRYSYGAPGVDYDQVIRKDDVTAQRNYLWTGWEDRLAVHAGVVLAQTTLIEDAGLPGRGIGHSGLAGLALQFDDQEMLVQVPGLAYGTAWDLVLESNDVINSDFEGEILQARFSHILDLLGRDTLNVSLAAGAADAGAQSFTLGGGYDDDLFGRDSVSLMGYQENVQQGHFYIKERVSWNHWLGRHESNMKLFPFGIGDYSMTLYGEAGTAWYRQHKANWLPTVGAEIRAEVVIGYRLLLPMVLGYAQGLDEGGERQIYLGAGYGF